MNQTSNYGLSQWDEQDRILREDFNADNLKTEQALAGLAEGQTALAAEIAKRGNCEIWTTSYTGTGKGGSSNKNSVTFPKQPTLFVILKPSGVHLAVETYGCSYVTSRVTAGGTACPASWSGNTVSWYDSSNNPTNQMNESKVTYQVFAFFKTA